MDESEAIDEEASPATPIFGVYRRGYDPEQVDRYVGDQQRRLDEAVHRASESERKLAAAVGQLRELHRRVAVYESEARNAQPPQLDTLGERVQRILQEAWEGAYNLRQEAEREVNELREQTQQDVEAVRLQARTEVEELREVASREAAEVVDEATRRALHIRDETERRRQAYLERVERDREQAIGQITYLYDQRQGAIAELARLQATVQATIEEMVRSPLGRPAPGVADAAADGARASRSASSRAHPATPSADAILAAGPGGLISPGSAGGSGLVIGERPPVDLPTIDPNPDITPAGDRPTRPDATKPSSEASHLPGILGSPPAEVTEMAAGADLPTGPMERFVRPSDRDVTGSAGRKADAEANAMERVMSQGPPSGPVGASGTAVLGQNAHPAGLGLHAPSGDVLPPTSGRSGAGKAGAMLGGLIRPRRQPLQHGVYDAEEDT